MNPSPVLTIGLVAIHSPEDLSGV